MVALATRQVLQGHMWLVATMLGSEHRNFWEGVHGPLGSEDVYVNTHTPCGERMKGVCPRKRKRFKVIDRTGVYTRGLAECRNNLG